MGHGAGKGTAWGRRAAVLGIVAAGTSFWWARPLVAPLFAGKLSFEPLKSPEGFRSLAGTGEGVTSAALVGIGSGPSDSVKAEMAAARADLCNAVFGGARDPGVVPVAVFKDYNCPYCRILTGRLIDYVEDNPGAIRLVWHEWARLGPSSVTAAKAALAAEMQGGYIAFHRRLMRARFALTDAYIQTVARDVGLDADRLLADMNSEAVRDRMRRTDAVARLFGFVGTPALVVGRTVATGAISEATFAALVEKERGEGLPPVCRG